MSSFRLFLLVVVAFGVISAAGAVMFKPSGSTAGGTMVGRWRAAR